MSPVSNDNLVSDEEYLVSRAKECLKLDPYAAKSWMITAKMLFPNNFGIQFEAYQIEKSSRNVKEAAKCFSDLFKKFQDVAELWQEVQALTVALRSESGDSHSVFLREMFSHIKQDVQRNLLLVSADRSEDTMEHCRLLLLLLRQFPKSVTELGPKLVDTLLIAEKHCHYQNSVNCYRKLLVCDLLPLLGTGLVELPPKQLFRLLHKSIEFYLAYLMLPNKAIEDLPELESKIDQPWANLFAIQEMTGKKLGWELSSIFAQSWNKELFWQKLLPFRQSRVLSNEDTPNHKQLLYCTTTFFLYCLHEYMAMLDTGGGEVPLVLVEAFAYPMEPDNPAEPKIKRRKLEIDETVPLLTVAKPATGTPVPVIHNFLMAVRCWDLLHSSEILDREFTKLSQHLRLETWLQGFLIDLALYKGLFDDALTKLRALEVSGTTALVRRNLHMAGTYYCQGLFSLSMEHILLVVSALPSISTGTNSGIQLSQVLEQPSRSNRHMHYLPLARTQVLQYCVKLLVSALKQCLLKLTVDTDLVIGHMITLLQLDWPLEEELFNKLMERIRQKGSFSYTPFASYVVNVDILEEFMYLSTEQGGSISLDIIPSTLSTSQRRISTRGADKGVKEDFKMAMRRQVARSSEPLDLLIIKFLSNERELLLQSLH
ncbi:integrator complex subunit 10 [Anabrus simplex]|uniref:integrator complex subunit 10 n=1 Tax=Anabrus simplex TaxID=316456 RepID=UPI0034DD57ED